MADLLAFVGDVYCSLATFPCGILGQVWFLIVSVPDLCRLSNFNILSAIGIYVMDLLSYSSYFV